MIEEDKRSKYKEIWSLLSIIGGGSAFALFFVVFLIYFYGPSGLYEIKSTLLSPSVFSELNYKDVNPNTGGNTSFVFDQVEYFYYNKDQGRWGKIVVSQQEYVDFFNLIKNDTSVQDVSNSIVDQFQVGHPASLKFGVKSVEKKGGSSSKKTLQEMVLVRDGDYYKVSIHNAQNGESWAYFYHPGIYRKAMDIFKN
ncbi:MAG: hypothetical protein VX777_06050 [Chlamydiota bacterium]|nr:hypothetical protein [Chlamydiota bacterium]